MLDFTDPMNPKQGIYLLEINIITGRVLGGMTGGREFLTILKDTQCLICPEEMMFTFNMCYPINIS